jgi:methyl-accepting chemotaxis protein
MKTKRTIALSLTVVVLFIFTVGQGSVWVWFLFTQKWHNQGLLENKMRFAANFVADSSREALIGDDAQALERYLGGISANEDVLSVKILDKYGTVVAEKEFMAEERSGSLNPLYMPWANKLTVPIMSGSSHIGDIELFYSGREVNEVMLRMMTIPTLIEGVVIFLVIGGIFFHLHRTVGKPLGVIEERIGRATEGDLTVEIPDCGNNEIGVIAKGLRFLVGTLLMNISKINQTAANVVTVSGELNGTFKSVNAAIKEQSVSTDNIAKSLRQASDAYRDITESTEKLSEFSGDNVSFLLEVKSTSEEIVSNTSRLFKASEDSYSVVAEMAQTSKVVAQNSQDVLSSVDGTLVSIEELRASVKEVERNAKESTALAGDVREKAAMEGTLVVADAIDGMDNISSRVQQAVDMVEQLGARSTDVQKMLSVIREVTEQTNLLSLNAAILAEQAGEFGKGFAVVADEMRALSDRTVASTKDIAGIVKTIQDETQGVVVAIKEGMEMVKSGSALVYTVGECMGVILEAAAKSSTMAKAIESATAEQGTSLDLVTESMSNISTMASRMSEVMAEQLRGSEHMLERVGEVREITEITKRSTEEQAKGTAMMSKNVELAGTKISGINSAAFEQQNVNEAIVSSVEAIRALGGNTLRNVGEMTISLNRLAEQIDTLQKEMSSFKVS